MLAVGVISLRRAADAAIEVAQARARDAAAGTAREMRRVVGDSRVIVEFSESDDRFRIAAGKLVISPENGWLDSPPETALGDAPSAAAIQAVEAINGK